MLYSFLTNFIEPFSYLIYGIAFLLKIKKDKTGKTKVLLSFYLLATLLMAYASCTVSYNRNNNWVYNLLYLLAAVAICYYFIKVFRNGKKTIVINCLIAANISYFIINNFVLKRFFDFDSLGYSLLSVSISVIALMYFYHVLENVGEFSIWHDFNFWLVSGYLVYFLGSFFIFLTWYYLSNQISDTYTLPQREMLTMLWGVHNVLLFIGAVITLSGGLRLTYRK